MSQGRSGGTLLAQCFEDVDGGVEVYCEPDIFMHFAMGQFDDKTLKRIVFSFCQRLWTSNQRLSTIVIKMPPQHPWLIKPLLRIQNDMKPFFEMSFLFNYRNPIDTTKSIIK